MSKTIITVADAREWLRLDNSDNDPIIEQLLDGASEYIETATGLNYDQQLNSPLCKTATKFLLSLWYDPTQKDTDRLQRTVDNLLKTIRHGEE